MVCAVDHAAVLQRVRERLVQCGALGELYHFDRLSAAEADLLVMREALHGDTR